MITSLDNLKAHAETIKSLTFELIDKHSEIYQWNHPDPDDSVVVVAGDYAWKDLSPQGKRTQARALEEFRRFYEIVKTLFKNQSEADKNKLEEHQNLFLTIVEQNRDLYDLDKEKERDQALSAIDRIISLLDHVYDNSGPECVFVPDTNALIYNPDIEKWEFEDASVFTVVLTPTVLQELDSLKMPGRNENVRKKAESVIRRIKEYRRRGSLTEGVTVTKNKIFLKSMAIEPDMADTLSWLDKNNNDDRLLSGFIEVMRQHLRSTVTIVTRDLNLQNKAEFARLPFIEPPDPN